MATPRKLNPFPGIARMVTHPVYLQRTHLVRQYDPKTGEYVYSERTSMVVDPNTGKPRLKMETKPDGSGFLVATALVPNVKPHTISDGCARGQYRNLKAMAKDGLLRNRAFIKGLMSAEAADAFDSAQAILERAQARVRLQSNAQPDESTSSAQPA